MKLDLSTIEIQGIAINDYPDFCDSYISKAKDTKGKELTSEELDEFMENNSGFVCEFIHDNQLYIRD